MHTIHSVYLGELRTTLKHLSSNIELFTDAPLDNQGKGESFSPTDLMCASLASCALTIAGIAANTHQFNIDGVEVEITKKMVSNPRKVGEIGLRFFNFPNQLSDKQKSIFENAVKTCPVMLSLSADVIKSLTFDY
jgi:putative redox protein